MRCKSGLLIIFAILAFSSVSSLSVAITATEFRADNRPHMKVVGYGMPRTFELAPQDFPDLTLWMVKLYSRPGYLHDSPKEFNLKQLQAYGYKGRVDIATILGQYHRVKIRKGTGGANAIRELNRIEALRKESLFYQRLAQPPFKYSPEKIKRVRQQMDSLERIVDWTVTCLYRRDALGIEETGKYLGARHLAEWAHAPQWQIDLSKALEDILISSYKYKTNAVLSFRANSCGDYLVH